MRMTKAILSLFVAVLFAASPAFAGEKTCCANASGKMECSQIYAKLNLTAEQKGKLDSLQARCEKDGCTEDSMKKFLAGAKDVLSTEQYTQLKAECTQMEKHPAEAKS